MSHTISRLSIRLTFLSILVVFQSICFSADDANGLFAQGMKLLQTERTEQGINLLKQYVAEHPAGENADAGHMLIGIGHLKQKKPQVARQWFEKLVKDYPDSPHVAEAQRAVRSIPAPRGINAGKLAQQQRQEKAAMAKQNIVPRQGTPLTSILNPTSRQSRNIGATAQQREPAKSKVIPSTATAFNIATPANMKRIKEEQGRYEKAKRSFKNERYDKAEAAFKKIIETSQNPILVGGSRTHLEMIAQKRGQKAKFNHEAQDVMLSPLTKKTAAIGHTLYRSLVFTVTQNRINTKTQGKELSLGMNVESADAQIAADNIDVLEGILSTHLKKHLEEQPYDSALSVNASYIFFNDYQPVAGLRAEFMRSAWVFTPFDTTNIAALERPPTPEELQNIRLAERQEEVEQQRIYEEHKKEQEAFRLSTLKPKPLPTITVEAIATDEILKQLAPIRKQIDQYQTLLAKYKNTPISEHHREEIHDYIKGEAVSKTSVLLKAALMQLQNIPKDDLSGYERWDRDLSKPIRTTLGNALLVWQRLFNTLKDTKAHAALAFNDGSEYSETKPLLSKLFSYQYDWIKTHKLDSAAKLDYSLASDSGGKDGITYKEPGRIQFHLDTPTEIFFEGIGQQLGQGIAAFMSYKGKKAEFDRQISASRAAFFNCYPDCENATALRNKFSAQLLRKDIHYLQQSGNADKSSSRLHKGLSSLEELMSGSGSSLVDDGIPSRCQTNFGIWTRIYAQALNITEEDEMNKGFSTLGDMLSGKMVSLQKQGQQKLQRQKLAFKHTDEYYGRYQLCRDQWEFDQHQ